MLATPTPTPKSQRYSHISNPLTYEVAQVLVPLVHSNTAAIPGVTMC